MNTELAAVTLKLCVTFTADPPVVFPSPIFKEKLPPPGGTVCNPGIVGSTAGATTLNRVDGLGQQPACVSELALMPSVTVQPEALPVSKSTLVQGACTDGLPGAAAGAPCVFIPYA